MFLRHEDTPFRPVIHFDAIPERWSIADDCSESDNGESGAEDAVTPVFSVDNVEVANAKLVLPHNEKYRAVFTVWQRIAESVADKGKCGFENGVITCRARTFGS